MKLDLKELLSKVAQNIVTVNYGTVKNTDMTNAVISGQNSSYAIIQFSKTYQSPPVVFITENNQSLVNYGGVLTSATDVTTTQFRLNAHNIQHLASMNFFWVSIGR